MQKKYAVFFLLCSLVYLQTLPYEPVYDDNFVITQNPLASDPFNVEIWTSRMVKGMNTYRPLTLWSYALNRRVNESLHLDPMAPYGFHLANLLLHFLVVCLLFNFLRRLDFSEEKSMAAALLFAVLPIHVEAVTNISGRSEMIAAAFGLLFLIGHVESWHLFLTSTLLMASMLGKESGIIFLGLAILTTLLKKRFELRRFVTYAGVTIGWYELRQWVIHSPLSAGEKIATRSLENPTVHLGAWDVFLNSCQYQMYYLIRSLFPFHLASDSSYNQIPLVTSLWHPAVSGFLILGITSILIAWKYRKKEPLILFFLGFYCVSFSVTSNFFKRIATVVGERLAYTPSMALCALAAMALFSCPKKYRLAMNTGFAVLLALFSSVIIRRNPTWKNEFSLYRAQVADAPNSAKAHYNYAAQLANMGRDADAIKEYERALSIYPDFPEAIYNYTYSLGRTHASQEKARQLEF